MKVLVTGGAGFIGSHIADALIQNGYQVHVVDNLSTGRRENIPEAATFHDLDVRSERIQALFEREQFRLLVHQAAQMDVRVSVSDPRLDASINVLGFLNLMEAGRAHGLERVLFASTGGAIYGEPEYVPQDEAHPVRPLSPYGITKLTTERYLHFYEQQYGIDYVALRYANVYGPRQNPHGEAGVVAIFAERLLREEQPVINGDGLQTRDYVYVSDVVRANLAALSHRGSGRFNIGTSIETNVCELFRKLRDQISPAIEERHGEGKPGEQRRSVLSFERAYEQLGWSPQIALDQGLAETVDWFRTRDVAGIQEAR
jgi:UDP-glucose 4-epimerase